MFGFPKTHREKGFKFKTNLLKSATFQLKFAESNTVKPNREKLKTLLETVFPIMRDIFKQEVRVKFEKEKTPVLESAQSEAEGFEFQSEDKKKIFRLTETTFTYTIFGDIYTNFEDIKNELDALLLPALGVCQIPSANWVSIRKTNILETTSPENRPPQIDLLKNAFNETLIKNILSLPNSENVESQTSNITLKTNGYKLNLNYGLLSNAIDRKIENPQLILDIDLISQGDFPMKNIGTEWDKINDEIFNIFNWSITESLKESLNN